MKIEKWTKRWRCWISARPVAPGVWKRKEGGYLVRGRALDPRTGKMKEIKVSVVGPDVTVATALKVREDQIEKIRRGGVEMEAQKIRFSEYAASLFERKVLDGSIRSAKGRQKWGDILELHLLPVLGDIFVDAIRPGDVQGYRNVLAREVHARKISPRTANTRLSVLRTILSRAVVDLELARDPTAGLELFDTIDHATYSDEQPNALTPKEVPRFLEVMRDLYPQHLAFVALGFATGLRPSSLRPLRRGGDQPDVLWEEGVLLVRRSHTVGMEVMQSTKQGSRYRLSLPSELVEVLRWHLSRLDELQLGSDLLFPSVSGGFRSSSCLDKPFSEVAKEAGITKHLTPRCMRRTFQDLARAAEVKDIVTRAVSGHATAAMQHHYSTVAADEIREGIASIISLAKVKELMAVKRTGTTPDGVHQGVLGPAEAKTG